MAAPKPTLVAANLCDMAVQEAGTGKWSLIGLFSGIRVVQFPTLHPQLAVYFCLSGAQGEYTFVVDLARLNDDTVFGRMSGSLNAKNRFQAAELGITLRGVPFEKPGRYAFRLTMNDQFIGDKVFEVTELKLKDSPHDQ